MVARQVASGEDRNALVRFTRLQTRHNEDVACALLRCQLRPRLVPDRSHIGVERPLPVKWTQYNWSKASRHQTASSQQAISGFERIVPCGICYRPAIFFRQSL